MSRSGPTVFASLITKGMNGRGSKASERAGLQKTVFATDIYNRDGEFTNDKYFSVDMNEYLPLQDVVFNCCGRQS